jgi:2-polyprenyl-3-methyl-5-hydroxy-6-metoxy-1,4-benzoquinol methylase
MLVHRVNLTVSIYLPDGLYRLLRKLKQRPRVVRNLLGDRDIEWSWIVSHMPPGTGEALDFGSGGSSLALVAAQRGFTVTAVDLQSVRWFYSHPHLDFIQGDILELSLPKERFDLVINL